MSWSGDIAQIGNCHIHWNVPKDGGALWTDNMLIPKGGNVYTASVYMNYVYDPSVMGLMEAGDPKRNITGDLLHPARDRREAGGAQAEPCRREQPADLPVGRDALAGPSLRQRCVEQPEVPDAVAEPDLGLRVRQEH